MHAEGHHSWCSSRARPAGSTLGAGIARPTATRAGRAQHTGGIQAPPFGGHDCPWNLFGISYERLRTVLSGTA